MIRVKICCITDARARDLAIAAGADALGFVSAMPSGPGVIDDGTIAGLLPGVPPGVTAVLLTSLVRPAEIVAQQRRTGAHALQLCAPLGPDVLAELRRSLPGIGLMPVVHVMGPEALGEARDLAATADALLLDTGVRAGPERQLGGTGRTHDWSVSARIVGEVRRPVYLAGGLRPDNVAAAIAAVRPFAVDVCSGVRSNESLDADLLRAFLAAARSPV